LNNDDALDMFRKTDTKIDGASFLQMKKENPINQAGRALDALSKSAPNAAIALLANSAKSALGAKKVDFSQVVKMIDNMAALLKQEADDDLTSRDSCNESFTDSEAEIKEVGHALKGLNAEIEDAASVIDIQTSTIEKNMNEIVAAKAAMAEASKQRQEENAEFVEAVELNKEAVELIMKAKDKLNAYYNPDLVRKTMRMETSDEAAARNSAFVQQAPETWAAGARQNSSQKGSNVLALLDTIANDLNTDTQAMEHGEQVAQRDYEGLSQDLATQIVESNKSKTAAAKTKADTEGQKQTLESTLSMKEEEEADIQQTIQDLHGKCDFLLKNFEERKAARGNEIAGLAKAKAVLQGAKLD